MASLTIQTVSTYDEFCRHWHAEALVEHGVSLSEARNRALISGVEGRLFWQLLGQLDSDETLIVIPKWLAEQKVGFVDGATPTEFIGRIERETAKAILFEDAVAARPLTKLAHRIHQLEHGEGDSTPERNEWLDDRLAAHREAFDERVDVPRLSENWLPKSQIELAIRQSE